MVNQGIRTDAFFIPASRPARGTICGRTAAGKEGIVANDSSQQNDPATTDPTGTNAQAAPPAGGDGTGEGADYKALYEKALAESRKWEGRSKANLKQLEELRKQPAADRTVEERLAALEAENESLKATASRNKLVDSVAKATGLDRAIVAALNGVDEDALTEQAKSIASLKMRYTMRSKRVCADMCGKSLLRTMRHVRSVHGLLAADRISDEDFAQSLASTYGTICRSASPKQRRRFEASVHREWYSLLRDVRMRVLGG